MKQKNRKVLKKPGNNITNEKIEVNLLKKRGKFTDYRHKGLMEGK